MEYQYCCIKKTVEMIHIRNSKTKINHKYIPYTITSYHNKLIIVAKLNLIPKKGKEKSVIKIVDLFEEVKSSNQLIIEKSWKRHFSQSLRILKRKKIEEFSWERKRRGWGEI